MLWRPGSSAAWSRYGRDELVLVHGAATGVDSAFDMACAFARVDRDPNPAEWTRLGRRADPVRKAQSRREQ